MSCAGCWRNRLPYLKPYYGFGYLKFNDFKNFVDANKVTHVEFINFGEPFLNPEVLDIIKYAHEKNITLTTHTNGNFIEDNVIEGLVKYKFAFIHFSIDGASQKVYEIYRRGGNFYKAIDTIKKLNFYKNKYSSRYPEISWKYVIFGHNIHEIPKAKEMAKSLNVSLNFQEDFAPELFPPVPESDLLFVEEQIKGYYIHRWDFPTRAQACSDLWLMPSINWDGKFFGCCMNYVKPFGTNAFKQDLMSILNDPDYLYAKKMVMGIAPAKEGIPCTDCFIYKQRVRRGSFLDIEYHARHQYRYYYPYRKIG